MELRSGFFELGFAAAFGADRFDFLAAVFGAVFLAACFLRVFLAAVFAPRDLGFLDFLLTIRDFNPFSISRFRVCATRSTTVPISAPAGTPRPAGCVAESFWPYFRE